MIRVSYIKGMIHDSLIGEFRIEVLPWKIIAGVQIEKEQIRGNQPQSSKHLQEH